MGASREIRAALIRWMCVDHQAQGLVDPAGIRVLGARIVGVLNLALVSVPIPIVLENCVFIEAINLGGTEIPYLELDGSYTREIDASGLHVRNNLSMGKGFHAVGGILFLDHAKIGLDLDFGGARLRYAKNPEERFLDQLPATLFAYLIQVGGNVWLELRLRVRRRSGPRRREDRRQLPFRFRPLRQPRQRRDCGAWSER